MAPSILLKWDEINALVETVLIFERFGAGSRMTILNLQQLIRELKRTETRIKDELKDHVRKINSLEMETIATLRKELRETMSRVQKLERDIDDLKK
jgi:predicted RNase H-like nuclease (RuvC/YqgF family)